MKSYYIIIFFSIVFTFFTTAQTTSNVERLGYSTDVKLLIIHADDLGVTHSENMASIKALEESPVNSASIMVPCPWFPEIAAYAIKNSSIDFGLHLTLTSEWQLYKWGPITSKDSVSSLINKDGYFYPLVSGVKEHATSEHVKLEIDNQIKRAYANGIDVTHLDAHMGTAAATPDFMKAYIEAGRKYRLPVLLDRRMPALHDAQIQNMLSDRDVIMDRTYTAIPQDYEKGMESYYRGVLNRLEPGLNCLLIHLAYDDAEMQGVTINHPNWGAKWRQADFDFFTSPQCEDLLKKNNIKLVTWREVRDKIVRAE